MTSCRGLIGIVVLVCLFVLLAASASARPGSTRLLTPAEMANQARGAAPTDPCTVSITIGRQVAKVRAATVREQGSHSAP